MSSPEYEDYLSSIIDPRDVDGSRRSAVVSWLSANLKPLGCWINQGADDHLEDSEDVLPTDLLEIRSYQLEAWEAIWCARQNGATTGLIHLATGLGKTSVAAIDFMKFREEFRQKHGRDPKALFRCHKNDILTQAAERFTTFMPDLTIGFYNGEQKDIGSDIVFGTMQALHVNLHNIDEYTFDYIIDDEVHHAMAHTYEKVVRHFKPQFMLGLTATPDRTDQKDIRDLYGQELYSKGLAEALSEGWLAMPDYHIVFDDAVKEAMNIGFKASSLKALAELFRVRPRNDVIVKNIHEEIRRIGLNVDTVKTIVFCQSVEHAEEMAKLLGGKAYHSDGSFLNEQMRKKVFDDFKDGSLQLITTVDMFNEGVDVPDARLLVFLRSTASPTVFEQQLGRGLRKSKDKDTVSVLDFAANIERIAMIRALSNNIRQHESDADSNIEDDTGDPTTGSSYYTFHTNHGDFEFDTLSIELLTMLQELKDQIDRTNWEIYSNQQIIDMALSYSPDSALRDNDIDALSRERLFPSRSVILKRWGTLTKFWISCGFDVRLHASDLNDAELVDLITESLGDGILPNTKLLNLAAEKGYIPNYSALIGRFGSLRAIQEACGFSVSNFAAMDKEDLVALALELREKYGHKSVGQEFIDEMSRIGKFASRTVITRIFGGVADFRSACGESARSKNNTYDQTPDSEIVRIALELSPDKKLTAAAIDGFARQGLLPNRFIIIDRFGTLMNFQEACGFRAEEITRERVIEMALEISPERPLTTPAINALSKSGKFVSGSTVYKLFGSYRLFHIACGFLEEGPSKEDVIAMARDICPDRPLTVSEIKSLFRSGRFVSYDAIIRLFGSASSFQEECMFGSKTFDDISNTI